MSGNFGRRQIAPVNLAHGRVGDALPITAEAAKYLGLSVAWLERDRTRARSLVPYIKIEERAVRYRLGDLRTYVRTRTTRG